MFERDVKVLGEGGGTNVVSGAEASVVGFAWGKSVVPNGFPRWKPGPKCLPNCLSSSDLSCKGCDEFRVFLSVTHMLVFPFSCVRKGALMTYCVNDGEHKRETRK